MKQTKVFALPVSILAVLVLFAVAHAGDSDNDKLGPYKQIATIPVPSGLVFPGGGFDISWVDSESGRYYLADRGNPGSKCSGLVPAAAVGGRLVVEIAHRTDLPMLRQGL